MSGPIVFLKFLLLLFFLFLISCNRESSVQERNIPTQFDTLDVAGTLKQINALGDSLSDESLTGLLLNLKKEKRFDLLEAYLDGYKRQPGTTTHKLGIENLFAAVLFFEKADFDSAGKCYNKAIHHYYQTHSVDELILSLSGAADNYYMMGKYDMAIDCRYYAIQLMSNEQADPKEMYGQIGSLGCDYMGLENLKKANVLLDSALRYFTQISDSENIAAFSAAKSYQLLLEKKYDESLLLAENALRIRRGGNDSLGIAAAYNNLAIAYMARADWSYSLQLLHTAVGIYERQKNYKDIPVLLINMGLCYMNLGQTDQAISSMTDAWKMAEVRKQLNEAKTALYYLYYINNKRGDYFEALKYYKLQVMVRDTIYNNEKERAVQEVATKFGIWQNEQKVQMISREKDYVVRRSRLIVLLFISLFVAGTAVVAFFVVRFRQNRQLLIARQQMQQLEIAKLQQEAESNKNALISFTRSLISKSQLIEELEEKVIEYEDKDYTARILKNINDLKNRRILTEDDWKSFRNAFEKCYPGFIMTIQERFEFLSPAELRLILLIRLKINTSDTASMLGISPASVRKSRTRLKRKLHLSEDDDLYEFVSQC